jgi:hypothetical protein
VGEGLNGANGRGELLVHFHLDDGKHAMDAHVLHACEGHVLGVVRELARLLDCDFQIEAHALDEGGVEVWLTFIGKHAAALTVIGGLIAAMFSAGQWVMHGQPLLRQQAELNDLNVKKLKLEIKKMEAEAAPDAARSPATAASKPLNLEPPLTVEQVAPALEGSRKLVHLRSQFYENLLKESRVNAVGFAPLHHPAPTEERVVRREQFAWYVVQTTEVPPQRFAKVELEVIAPVLQRRNLKWRGLFSKHSISFEIADQRFLDKVASKRVAFQNGTTLLCDLLVLSRLNEAGDVEAYSYVVEKVHRHFAKALGGNKASQKSRAGRPPAQTEDSAESSGDLFDSRLNMG